jgi:hypothetical protein
MSRFEFDPWVESADGSSLRCATNDKRFLVLVDAIAPYQRPDGQAVWNLTVATTGHELIGAPMSFPRAGAHAIDAEGMKELATHYAARFIGEHVTAELREEG